MKPKRIPTERLASIKLWLTNEYVKTPADELFEHIEALEAEIEDLHDALESAYD